MPKRLRKQTDPKKGVKPKKMAKVKPLPDTIKHLPYQYNDDLWMVHPDDAPKHPAFPRLSKAIYPSTYYVYNPVEKRAVFMVTLMPDDRPAAWSSCSTCLNSFGHCTCTGGLIENKSIVWMMNYVAWNQERDSWGEPYDQRHQTDPKYTRRPPASQSRPRTTGGPIIQNPANTPSLRNRPKTPKRMRKRGSGAPVDSQTASPVDLKALESKADEQVKELTRKMARPKKMKKRKK